VIRWGADASSDVLRRAGRCTVCGHKGATPHVEHARHISQERRAQLEESYLTHEREARIHIPRLGIARVLPFPLESMMRPLNPGTDIKGWARFIVWDEFRIWASVRGRALCLGA
jgi:hypothetical protein